MRRGDRDEAFHDRIEWIRDGMEAGEEKLKTLKENSEACEFRAAAGSPRPKADLGDGQIKMSNTVSGRSKRSYDAMLNVSACNANKPWIGSSFGANLNSPTTRSVSARGVPLPPPLRSAR